MPIGKDLLKTACEERWIWHGRSERAGTGTERWEPMLVVQRAAEPRSIVCCVSQPCSVRALCTTRGYDDKRHKAGLQSLIPRCKAAMGVDLREGHQLGSPGRTDL